MPKHRSRSYLSSNNSRVSPYSRRSKHREKWKSKTTFPFVGDEKEWEETRCPICIEHPHNAVLLLCSSHEKGCRPYMCDTSHRHSNCLDQFCKSPSSAIQIQKTEFEEKVSGLRNFKKLEKKLPCPLCRGQICGWVVVETARSYMNVKRRSCSLESCKFSGTYSELRVHARGEHPSLRPAEADPKRKEEWTRLEGERIRQDLLTINSISPDIPSPEYSSGPSPAYSPRSSSSEPGTYFRHYSSPGTYSPGSWDRLNL